MEFLVFWLILFTGLATFECGVPGKRNDRINNGQGNIEKINNRKDVSVDAERELRKHKKDSRGQDYQEYPDEEMDEAKKLLKCIRKEFAQKIGHPDPEDDRLLIDDVMPTLPQVEDMATQYIPCREEAKKGKKNGGRSPRQVPTDKYNETRSAPGSWNNSVVNWRPDSSNITSSHLTLIRNALEGIKIATGGCITFNEVGSGFLEDHIKIQTSSGCWSSVGNTKRGSAGQTLNLDADGCMHYEVIQHEFLHALGILHEQSRSDRDDYVTIVWDNIQSGREGNFWMCTDCVDNAILNDLTYDYKSVMHYSAWAFSDGSGATIVSNTSESIAPLNQLTTLDASLLRKLYCPSDPVNCLGSWSAYSSCSRTCGGGTQSRTYTVEVQASNGGTPCEASNGLIESLSCNSNACIIPVNCVGSWGAYGSCSKTCGGGTQTRTYTITIQAQNGGTACEAANGQTAIQNCNTQECTVFILSAYNQHCNDACDEQLGEVCNLATLNTLNETKIHEILLSLDSSSSCTDNYVKAPTWVDHPLLWGKPPATIECHGWGTREPSTRNATCTGLNGGTGSNYRRLCECDPAPTNCVGTWSVYGSCSKTCGGGIKSRTYTITTPAFNGGTPCEASNGQIESLSCNTDACAPIDCVGSWSAYGSCSKTCGAGTQTRAYSITTQVQHGGTPCEAANGQTQTQICNTQACTVFILSAFNQHCTDACNQQLQQACNLATLNTLNETKIHEIILSLDPSASCTENSAKTPTWIDHPLLWGNPPGDIVCHGWGTRGPATHRATCSGLNGSYGSNYRRLCECDLPSTTDCGTCKTSKSTPNCSETTIQSCVCAVDPYCCDSEWDSICVGEIGSVCGVSCA